MYSKAQEGTARTSNARSRLLREFVLVGLGYLIYAQVRGLAGDRVVDAFANAEHVVQIEQKIGIFRELALQTWVLPNNTLVDFFNVFYFYGLFPLLLPTAAWLFWKRPEVYTLTRNAFLISGGIAVIFFLLLPTAPPRLLEMGFIDTLGQSLTPTYDSIPGVNHFAAVPSMHVGWNFLTAVALYMSLAGYWWRGSILVIPVIMFTATVVTGNHYFIDGVLGVIVASVALKIAFLIRERGRSNIVLADRAIEPELQAPSSL